MIVPVILAGGSGTRLWPLSRRLHPKQFFSLWDDRSLLQNTVERVRCLDPGARPLVLCNHDHRFMVAEQLRSLGVEAEAIVLEPVGRNTAPAIAAAAHLLAARGLDPILLVLPSDHFIRDVATFHRVVKAGCACAAQGHLITFGIVANAPETGYGYLRKGAPIHECADAFRVARFVEKPDLETARAYLASGDYFWNSGMFLFRASSYLEQLQRHAPQIFAAAREAVRAGRTDLDFFRLDPSAFQACPSDSIDYAVMEKTDRAAMLLLDAGWDDVGSWEALWQVGDKDGNRNILEGDVLVHQVTDSYINATSRLVAAVGLKGHVVVETADAVMISPRHCTQEVKRLVEILKGKGRAEADVHRRRYRPWGVLEVIVQAPRFRVNRLTLRPGAGISLQKHHRRCEHWIVVQGTARVTRDSRQLTVGTDESVFIPAGVVHRIENPEKIPLEVIEVQTGDDLGEGDTIRLEAPETP
ncbi:MAG TPA: mannose-1-phosphate guanylyltransferase/mannose-6-phosphate isomerase [Desulfobacteraceae bacterium]|nr:mannose-1-phosphate guanylyltransferase/mannose-6-phosphate isomerase [Deltaproteobacteria bacterium]HDI59315.1 mannose-1-phosphate guanylyltransferase/mannose-6-phosphate isomerase [Desulfobacteraceae bacterium]